MASNHVTNGGYYEWKLWKLELTYFPVELEAYNDWGLYLEWKDRVEVGSQMDFDVGSDPNKVLHNREYSVGWKSKRIGGWIYKEIGGL